MKNLLPAAAGLLLCCSVAAQNVAVTTNVLDYVNFGTLNVEASCGIARQWSLSAGVKYNPFSFGEGKGEFADRQRSIDAGARFWPWHIYSGWWLSGKLKWQEYNRGGLLSEGSVEGDRYGGSLGAGYSFMLNTHLYSFNNILHFLKKLYICSPNRLRGWRNGRRASFRS